MTQLERIAYMESILNDGTQAVQSLRDALERCDALLPRLAELEAYYTSAQWMRDYEDDCAGRLPASLPRGVLSEDAADHLLDDMRRIRDALAEL